MVKLEINPELYENCNKCVEICPEGILKRNGGVPEIVDNGYCMSCGHCVSICSVSAIIHQNFSKKSIHNIDPNLEVSTDHILEILRTRRSIRSFKSNKVEKELLEKIIDAANFAPSAKNKQTTKYAVVQDEHTLDAITKITFNFMKEAIKLFNDPSFISSVDPDEAKIFSTIKPSYAHIVNAYEQGNDMILHNAPVLLFFYAKKGALSAEVNANLALHNAALMSAGIGLGSFYAGYITGASSRTEYIGKLLNIPDNHEIHAVLAIGYPKFQFKQWMDKKQPVIKWI
ncbi:nitroreductase family protein [Methanobacterium sp.]|uniref:nitroreductase family protein n=1 Tax=Methanobacterium sp. TaxID=2164 RepID=UPI003C778222